MLGENIKKHRLKKGLSQEALALSLNVVRQTVSKWEKGSSAPDAEMLPLLAELLDTTVETLLGIESNSQLIIQQELLLLSQQLAKKNRRAKRIWIGLAVMGGILLLMMLLSLSA